MPEDTNEIREPLVLLRSFPLDDTDTAEEEKIDTLWRQLMVYRSFAENDLAEARSRRAEAEALREQMEQQALEYTRAMCNDMKAEAESEFEEAKHLKLEAIKMKEEAEAEFSRARDLKEKAEKEREEILAQAHKDAEKIREEAHESAQEEATELRRQALKEIKQVLARVDSMRSATNEELETQRILTNVAKLKATSRWESVENSQNGSGNHYPDSEKALAYADKPASNSAAGQSKASSSSSTGSKKSQSKS